jgi:hypothetical protein
MLHFRSLMPHVIYCTSVLVRQGDVGAAWNSGSFHLNLGFEAEARVGFEAATNLMSAATAITTCEQTVAALQATESLLGCLQAQLQAVRAFLPRDLSAADPMKQRSRWPCMLESTHRHHTDFTSPLSLHSLIRSQPPPVTRDTSLRTRVAFGRFRDATNARLLRGQQWPCFTRMTTFPRTASRGLVDTTTARRTR